MLIEGGGVHVGQFSIEGGANRRGCSDDEQNQNNSDPLATFKSFIGYISPGFDSLA